MGNHCSKILKTSAQLCKIIEGSHIKEKVAEIFELFAEIHALMMANRFLSDDEISILCLKCKQFGQLYPIYFPNASIQRKVHELIFSVPRFVKKHKTIGLLSEQSGESLHAAVNMEVRQLVSVKDKSQQIRLVFERQELRSLADKKMLKRESRLFPSMHNSKKRSFLKTGKDKKKHCPICEPNFFKSLWLLLDCCMNFFNLDCFWNVFKWPGIFEKEVYNFCIKIYPYWKHFKDKIIIWKLKILKTLYSEGTWSPINFEKGIQ